MNLGKFISGGGKFADLFSRTTVLPEEPVSPSETGSNSEFDEYEYNSYKEQFFQGIEPDNVRRVDRRSLTEIIRDYFDFWKKRTIETLKQSSDPLVDTFQNITLKDMAYYAKQQFDRWSKEVGRAVPNTDEYEKARERSDFWSTMDEIMGPAADPN